MSALPSSVAANDAVAPDQQAPWWQERRDELLKKLGDRGSAYVYNLATVREQLGKLQSLKNVDRVFFAMKANGHAAILREVFGAGAGFECVAWDEIRAVQSQFPSLTNDRILFTPNFAPRREYERALSAGIRVTLDSLYPLENWMEIFEGACINLRIDPDTPRGHHTHVQTAGAQSKFGIPIADVDRAVELARAAGATVDGLHVHAGSGIHDASYWAEGGALLAWLAERIGTIRILNLGGGLGLPQKAGDPALDLAAVDRSLAAVKAAAPDAEIWLEPGRFIAADAGVLLTRATQVKSKGAVRFIGVETGMNSLIRPALYDAYHEIVNLSRLGEPLSDKPATIVGPICESGDVLGRERYLPETREGDVILIAQAGAYGAVMASAYNMRRPAPELIF